MKKYGVFILSLSLLMSSLAGCRDNYKIPDSIAMSAPGAGLVSEVEIKDVYCTESGIPKRHMFEFHFTLRNLKDEDMDIQYYWSLNDPLADGPGYEQHINDPIARVYQGQGQSTLLSAATSDSTGFTVDVKEIREYDPRFYRMYFSIYRDNSRIGFYAKQKSTYDWDYRTLPPVRTKMSGNIFPVPSTGITDLRFPDGNPIISEEILYIMQGKHSYLYIFEDGSIVEIEDQGLRMATQEHPATRTWKTGKIQPQDIDTLLNVFHSPEFANLEEAYLFPGKPIEGDPNGGLSMSDLDLQITINYGNLDRTVTASGYLSPDKGETYPDMPYPLPELYQQLRQISLNTVEQAHENID